MALQGALSHTLLKSSMRRPDDSRCPLLNTNHMRVSCSSCDRNRASLLDAFKEGLLYDFLSRCHLDDHDTAPVSFLFALSVVATAERAHDRTNVAVSSRFDHFCHFSRIVSSLKSLHHRGAKFDCETHNIQRFLTNIPDKRKPEWKCHNPRLDMLVFFFAVHGASTLSSTGCIRCWRNRGQKNSTRARHAVVARRREGMLDVEMYLLVSMKGFRC